MTITFETIHSSLGILYPVGFSQLSSGYSRDLYQMFADLEMTLEVQEVSHRMDFSDIVPHAHF